MQMEMVPATNTTLWMMPKMERDSVRDDVENLEQNTKNYYKR